MWTEDLNWPRVCTKKIHSCVIGDGSPKIFSSNFLASRFLVHKKFNYGYPSQAYRMTRVHIFFNKDFLQQEVNHCLQTNRPSLLHLRFFKRVICHFKSVSLHLCYDVVVDPIPPLLLSCWEVNHTRDFCLPFSVHSLKHLSVGPPL